MFRTINKAGRIGAKEFSPKAVWGVVKDACSKCGLLGVAPHDLRRYTESRTMPNRSDRCYFGVKFRANVLNGFGVV
jgi:hypothetical protein